VRVHCGQPEGGELDPWEIERVWHLHSTVIYCLVRKHIHGAPVPSDPAILVDAAVDTFIDGLRCGPGAGTPAWEAPR
jgi:hypothetical protein